MYKKLAKQGSHWKRLLHSGSCKIPKNIYITPFELLHTGKSISEALIFASTNPQYDNRFFIELPLQYMKIPSSEHGEDMRKTCCAHK